MKVFIILFFIFLPPQVNAQINPRQDSLDVKCDGKVFTRCEEPPSLKHGVKSYQKLLTNFLVEKKELPTVGKAFLYLAISKTGEVLDINVMDNSMSRIDGLLSAIKGFLNEWHPGKQNKHIVCAYKKIEIKVLEDKIIIVE